jgi:hypothetical protein
VTDRGRFLAGLTALFAWRAADAHEAGGLISYGADINDAAVSLTAPYVVRFIVTLNMVTQASFTCISLNASYEVSLISVQRTR